MVDLTEMEMDSLREIGNVGIGNSATALSKMIGKKVEIKIPCTEFIPIASYAEKAGGAEMVVFCMHIGVSGDLGGEALFFFQRENALRFVDLVNMQPDGTSKEFDEMSKSTLLELSNIVVGSYLNSVANMLKMEIFPEPPHAAEDMLQAVIDAVLAKLSRSADDVLYIETEFSVGEQQIAGSFTMLFDEKSLSVLLSKLKEVYGI